MVKSKNKNKTPKDKTAVRMKAAGIPPIIRKGEWEHNTPKRVPLQGMPSKHLKRVKVEGKKVKTMPKQQLALSPPTLIAMAKDRAGGMLRKQLSVKYHVSESYIDNALQHLFINNKIGREILKGVLLENAIACGMHGRAKVEELNGMQALVGAGIMTSRYVELDKHTQSAPDEVDFSDIAKISENLKQINDYVGPLGQYAEGLVIDVEATSETEADSGT